MLNAYFPVKQEPEPWMVDPGYIPPIKQEHEQVSLVRPGEALFAVACCGEFPYTAGSCDPIQSYVTHLASTAVRSHPRQ